MERLGAGLVHGQHNRLLLLQRIFLQVLDQAKGGARVETRAWFLRDSSMRQYGKVTSVVALRSGTFSVNDQRRKLKLVNITDMQKTQVVA